MTRWLPIFAPLRETNWGYFEIASINNEDDNMARLKRKFLPEKKGLPDLYEAARIKMSELGPFYHKIKVHGVWTTEMHDHPLPIWKVIYPRLPDDISDLKCLDIGCNSGFYSMILAHNGADVLGIDINQTGLDVVAQAEWIESILETGATFKKMDITKLPKTHNKTYDLALMLGVYHHLPDTDAALKKVKACLKKDGTLFFGCETNRYGPTKYYKGDSADYANDPFCYRIATPEDILTDLEKHGFELIEEIWVNTSLFYGKFRKK